MPDCCCNALPDLAAVPMGGDGLDERVFRTVERIADHGGDLWWLYRSKCTACGQDWLVAQEERIYDDYFMKRMTNAEVEAIQRENRWPDDFLTYECVLKIGKTHSRACSFLQPMASSLIWTVEDLRRARPDIASEEIAELLGITVPHALRLVAAAG